MGAIRSSGPSEGSAHQLGEIEITAAMIEAGVKALNASSRRYFDDAEIVENVFAAMVAPLDMPADAG
jgi:hypothetical protein